MPIIAALSTPARQARICCRRMRYSASSSDGCAECCGCASEGCSGLVIADFIKILLQNDGGRFGIDALAAPLRQHCRRITLIDQYRFDAVAAVQLIGETAGGRGSPVLGGV